MIPNLNVGQMFEKMKMEKSLSVASGVGIDTKVLKLKKNNVNSFSSSLLIKNNNSKKISNLSSSGIGGRDVSSSISTNQKINNYLNSGNRENSGASTGRQLSNLSGSSTNRQLSNLSSRGTGTNTGNSVLSGMSSMSNKRTGSSSGIKVPSASIKPLSINYGKV